MGIPRRLRTPPWESTLLGGASLLRFVFVTAVGLNIVLGDRQVARRMGETGLGEGDV